MWGYNGAGQLGVDSSKLYSTKPVVVQGLVQAKQIAPGDWFTCAVLDAGSARCWGRNDVGQLGNGATTSTSMLIAVGNLSNVVEISAGSGHACAVLTDGTVQCWGSGPGMLAVDGAAPADLPPVAVEGLSNVVEIAAGPGFTCARLSDGTVRCWGGNDSGQLGDGTLAIAPCLWSYRACQALWRSQRETATPALSSTMAP